jgi:hypothetical protein
VIFLPEIKFGAVIRHHIHNSPRDTRRRVTNNAAGMAGRRSG